MTALRFHADADLNHGLVLAVLRRRAMTDFRSATDAGLAGLDDHAVLRLAAAEGRILVTHDARTMPRHFADFIATAPSPGVIVVPQHLRIALAAQDLLLIAEATDPSDWRNRIAFLPI